MVYTEAQERLTKILSEPDTAQVQAVAFLEELKEDYATLETLTANVKTSEEKIRTLQDTNQKLFLMQMGKPTGEDETQELQGIDAVDAFVSDLMKEE